MKFLLDVCVSSRSLDAFLVGQGHDVLSAVAVAGQWDRHKLWRENELEDVALRRP